MFNRFTQTKNKPSVICFLLFHVLGYERLFLGFVAFSETFTDLLQRR